MTVNIKNYRPQAAHQLTDEVVIAEKNLQEERTVPQKERTEFLILHFSF